MKRRVVAAIAGAVVLCGGSVAKAQIGIVQADGRAFGTEVIINGQNQNNLMTADTGRQTALLQQCAGQQDTAGRSVNGAPVANVAASASFTDLCAILSPPEDSFAEAGAGSATVELFPNPVGPPLVEAVSTGCSARVDCAAISGGGGLEVLRVAGQRIPIPGMPPPNTQINVGPVRVILNAQTFSRTASDLNATVEAAIIRASAVGQSAVVTMSHCDTHLFVPPPTVCVPTDPFLFNLTKIGTVINDRDGDSAPDLGETVRYTVSVGNVGTDPAVGVLAIDRIPFEATADLSTLQINGVPMPSAGSLGPCPGTTRFPSCPGETAIDTNRQCLNVSLGDIQPGITVNFRFDADITSDINDGSICNNVVVGQNDALSLMFVDNLVTAGGGGGGCAIDGSRSVGDALPVALVLMGLGAVSTVRRRRSVQRAGLERSRN